MTTQELLRKYALSIRECKQVEMYSLLWKGAYVRSLDTRASEAASISAYTKMEEYHATHDDFLNALYERIEDDLDFIPEGAHKQYRIREFFLAAGLPY